jgi:hypothetical protein
MHGSARQDQRSAQGASAANNRGNSGTLQNALMGEVQETRKAIGAAETQLHQSFSIPCCLLETTTSYCV